MTAHQILATLIDSYGENRTIYSVTEEEYRILRNEADYIDLENSPNGDGTFYSSLVIGGRHYVHMSDKITGWSH